MKEAGERFKFREEEEERKKKKKSIRKRRKRKQERGRGGDGVRREGGGAADAWEREPCLQLIGSGLRLREGRR